MALEFIIVVAGVFIGIQVANWNTEIIERQEETAILERLRVEFLAIQETASGNSDAAQEAAQSTQEMLSLLVSRELPADFEVLATLIDATRPFPPPPPTSSTLSQLLANGEMSFLRDDELRTKLIAYHAARDTHVREDNLVAAVALNLGADYWQFSELSAAAATVDDLALQQSVYAAASDPDLVPALAAVLRQQRSNVIRHSETLETIEGVLDALK